MKRKLYSEPFKKVFKFIYGDSEIGMHLLNEGDYTLGAFIHGDMNRVFTVDEILDAESLSDLQATAMLSNSKKELYKLWRAEVY